MYYTRFKTHPRPTMNIGKCEQHISYAQCSRKTSEKGQSHIYWKYILTWDPLVRPLAVCPHCLVWIGKDAQLVSDWIIPLKVHLNEIFYLCFSIKKQLGSLIYRLGSFRIRSRLCRDIWRTRLLPFDSADAELTFCCMLGGNFKLLWLILPPFGSFWLSFSI
jgi:hypothetical protein